MARTVFCKKYQKDMEGLDAPPYPGPKGQDIFENISKQAWQTSMSRATTTETQRYELARTWGRTSTLTLR